MAHLQLMGDLSGANSKRRAWLIYAGKRLYVKGSSGEEKLSLELTKQVTLELAGTSDPVEKAKQVFSDSSKVKVWNNNGKPTVTIKAEAEGKANLKLKNPDGSEQKLLTVVAGTFQKHKGMEIDLIADICSGSDPVRSYALHWMLYNNSDNIFNENWDVVEGSLGKRACGDVCKIGGESLWKGKAPDAHSFHAYHIPFAANHRVQKRDEVKYNDDRVKRAGFAIKGWLEKNKTPVVVGVYYGEASKTNRFGQLERTEGGGHSVLIVGCNKAATQFLYIDPWNGGSKMKYEGGMAIDKFTDECEEIGLFEIKKEVARGSVLRQWDKSEGTFDTPTGDFLEIASGP